MIEAFFIGLVTGLFGSAHCLGMCGGIIAATESIVVKKSNKGNWFSRILTYNVGRITSYTLLGLIAGFAGLGLGVWYTGLILPLRLLAGFMMIAMGCYIAGWWFGLRRLEQLASRLFKPMQNKFSNSLNSKSYQGRFIAGLLWGYLPCGLVYSALSLSLAKANPLDSAILMFAFGLGTLPAVFLGGAFHQTLAQWLRLSRVRQGAGMMIIIAGIWTLAAPQLMSMIGHNSGHDSNQDSAHTSHVGHKN